MNTGSKGANDWLACDLKTKELPLKDGHSILIKLIACGLESFHRQLTATTQISIQMTSQR